MQKYYIGGLAMEEKQAVVFSISIENYALPIETVKEIITMQPISRLPNMPKHIEGVINLRQRIIAVVNLAKRLDMIASDFTQDTKIIIAGDNKIGFIVDNVTEIITYNVNDNIQKIDGLNLGCDNRCIEGVLKRNEKIIIVLKIDEIIKNI